MLFLGLLPPNLIEKPLETVNSLLDILGDILFFREFVGLHLLLLVLLKLGELMGVGGASREKSVKIVIWMMLELKLLAYSLISSASSSWRLTRC